MDVTDHKIIDILQKDGRISMKDLGKIVGLTSPAVSERVRRLEEAGIAAGMAGGAVLFYHNGQRVLIAVRRDGDDVLIIAAGFALEPELMTGAAVKAGKPGFQRALQAFTVHVGQRQHFLADGVHDDGRDQTLFIKLEFFNVQHGISLTKI